MGSPPPGPVPGEPGLVVVRVDGTPEREHEARELLLHRADEPVDLGPSVRVGQRVGVAAVLGPHLVDELASPRSVRLVPRGDVTLDHLLHRFSLRR